MGFEPTTLRDLSEFSKHFIYHVFVVSSLYNRPNDLFLTVNRQRDPPPPNETLDKVRSYFRLCFSLHEKRTGETVQR